MEDSEIIALFFERSEQAIDETRRKYGAAARHMASNILGDGRDAEECLNDGYFALWNAIPPALPASLCGYFCRIVRNIAARRCRADRAQKRNSRYDAALDELAASLPAREDALSTLEAKELAGAVNAFLDGLGYTDRYLFMRRYWYGDDLAAVAAQTGMTAQRVSTRLFRLRGRLKKYLKEEGMIP